jgi:hypothetical protein
MVYRPILVGETLCGSFDEITRGVCVTWQFPPCEQKRIVLRLCRRCQSAGRRLGPTRGYYRVHIQGNGLRCLTKRL